MKQEEFLVIYEEDRTDDQGDLEGDALVLDIRRLKRALHTEIDIETGVSVELSNTSSAMGLIGVIVSFVGAVLGLAATVYFALRYPEAWFVNDEVAGEAVRRLTAILAMAGGLLLILGLVLTIYGRRVTAQGRVDDAHIVEKSAHAHTELH